MNRLIMIGLIVWISLPSLASQLPLNAEGCDYKWQAVIPQPQGYKHLMAAAWSAQQQQFVIVGQAGTILTSPDEHNWTAQAVSFSGDFYDIAWDNQQWLAVGSQGAIYSSSDAISWEKQPSNTTDNLRTILYSQNLWVALSNNSILTSTDGKNWDTIESNLIQHHSQIISNGKQWLLYHPQGHIFYTSDNLTDWQFHYQNEPISGIFWDGKQWVLTNNKGLYRSTDGIAWQLQSDQIPNTSIIASDGDLWISFSNQGHFYTSHNALDWDYHNSYPSKKGILDLIGNGNTWLAVGAFGQIMTSTNGFDWQEIANGPPQERLHDLAWGNEQWIAAGDNGTIITSLDGIHWQKQASATHFPLSFIQWNGQDWLAIGSDVKYDHTNPDNTNPGPNDYDSIVLHSRDGKNWSIRFEAENMLFNSLEWDGKQWMIKSNQGPILLDSDASQWEIQTTSPIIYSKNIKWNGKTWMAIKWNGETIYHSHDGIHWQELEPLTEYLAQSQIHHPNLWDMEWNGKTWVIVGKATINDALILTSPDGLNWQHQIITDGHELKSVAYNDDQWIAVGGFNALPHQPHQQQAHSATILSSMNGEDWIPIDTHVDDYLLQVSWNGYHWVAIGPNNTILSSTDGKNWQPQNTDSEYGGYTKLAWNGKQWVAIGASGKIASSSCVDSCITQAAHYDVPNQLLHIKQLQVQGHSGTPRVYENISLPYAPNSQNILSFEAKYLDSATQSQLCTHQAAVLSPDGLLSIPTALYTPIAGPSRKYTDVLFQLNQPQNILQLQNAHEVPHD